MTLCCKHRLRKTLLASLMGTALAPGSGWALELAQSPPGTLEPYVAPNVILSLDDSGSMQWGMSNADRTSRANILKNALKDVFSDRSLLPTGKIRLAWHVMNTSPTSLTGNAPNSMRVLDEAHRSNFLQFVSQFKPQGWTPTHDMVQRADQYMREPLGRNSPWAYRPGMQAAPYLGCRRNYHILLTDGGWNGTERTTNPRNFDGSTRTLPDGTAYQATAAQSRLYRDAENYTTIADWAFKSWADPLQNASALQGKASPTAEYRKAPGTEAFTNRATQTTATLDKYWNPRYDPATWPHMVTFTIGFSDDALPKKNFRLSGSSVGDITAPSSLVPYGYDGNLADYANGTYAWRAASHDKGHDMWHAALNGRGQFYAVQKSEDLAKAFRQIVQQINVETEPDRGTAATSGSNLSRNDVGRFTAHYDPKRQWKGWITAEMLRSDGLPPMPGWSGKSSADVLDGLASHEWRPILSWSDKYRQGIPFQWAGDESRLSTAQKTWLQRDAQGLDQGPAKGQQRLNYIRGDRSMEGREEPPSYTAAKPFRQRSSIQGDIVNSEIWYVGAPVSNYSLKGYATFARNLQYRWSMIYVGGNDGMLHGFLAEHSRRTQSTLGDNGKEYLAYVPRGVIPALGRLADPDYNDKHRYYVDGSPMSGDVDLGTPSTPDWRTVLVGTLGAGGKGYFALDVTHPQMLGNSFGTVAFLENIKSTVLMDKTLHASEPVVSVAVCEDPATTPAATQETCLAAADMGHIFARPVLDDANPQRTTQIARLNNNRWAAVMGNGYDSKSERPVLLVQYLDGDKKLLRLVATGGTQTGAHLNTTDNGLSAPRLVDINSDGRPDVAYAGDLKGNLWKFLVADVDDSRWGVAQWGASAGQTSNHSTTGQPLFTAVGGTAGSPNARTRPQPITVAPSVRANDRNKVVTQNGQDQTVPVSGMMVAFGTGRNVTRDDPEDTARQTLYAVLDNTRYKLVGANKDHVQVCTSTSDGECSRLLKTTDDLPRSLAIDKLAQQKISTQAVHTRGERKFWTVDQTTAVDWSRHGGWYMDLPETGERLLKHMGFYDGSNLLAAYTQVPAKGRRENASTEAESCEAGAVDDERQYLTLFNIMDGKRPSLPLMDADGDGIYGAADLSASRMNVSKGGQTMIKKGQFITNLGGKDREDILATLPEQSVRPSWRQLR